VYYVIQTIIFLAEHNLVTTSSIFYETPAEFPGMMHIFDEKSEFKVK
jgi:hypothetical protein